MLEKPIYKLRKRNGKWIIQRPDGSAVNDWEWSHKEILLATKYLELLISYGICRGEE